MHGRRRVRERFDREEMTSRGIWVCRLCHRQIHRLHDQQTLAMSLNTREALVREPQMASFLAWARRQK